MSGNMISTGMACPLSTGSQKLWQRGYPLMTLICDPPVKPIWQWVDTWFTDATESLREVLGIQPTSGDVLSMGAVTTSQSDPPVRWASTAPKPSGKPLNRRLAEQIETYSRHRAAGLVYLPAPTVGQQEVLGTRVSAIEYSLVESFTGPVEVRPALLDSTTIAGLPSLRRT